MTSRDLLASSILLCAALACGCRSTAGSTTDSTQPAQPTSAGAESDTAPATDPEQPAQSRSAPGTLGKEDIRRVVRANIREVRRCYEAGLMRDPKLTGTVKVNFTIDSRGTVIAATGEPGFPDQAVTDCVVAAARTFVFPIEDGRADVVVTYPFVLQTDGGDAPAP